MNQVEKKNNLEYFGFWQQQNKLTLFSLITILLVCSGFAIGIIVAPGLTTTQLVVLIITVPTLACIGIAASHSSNLEATKAQRAYNKLLVRLMETENSQITLDRFFSISSDLMAVAGSDGHLKKASTSLINTLGYSEEVLLSTPFFEFIHPDDQEPTRKNIESLNLGIRSVGFENRYRAADGTYRTLSWSAAADAELGVRYASARDVTEERNFQTRTQQILDASPFLMVVKDRNGIIRSCNSAFADSLGIPRNALLGRSAKHFLASDAMAWIGNKEDEVLKSQKPHTFEEVLLSDGEALTYLSTIFPIHDQTGNVISLGKVSLNIGLMGK